MHVFPSLDSDPIQNVMGAILALPLMFPKLVFFLRNSDKPKHTSLAEV